MKSSFLSLNWKDLGKAVLVVALFAGLTPIQSILGGGSLPTLDELASAGIVALKAGGVYLLKNFLTNSVDQFAKKEAKA